MDELDEKVLDITQRQKRAQIMRRYKAKIERSREIAQKRLAPEKNIKKRAYAQARQIVRKRFAGKRGAEYEKLGPSEKMAIDRAIEKKAGLIKKIALRLIPKVKSAEAKRLQSFHKGQQLQNHGAEEGHKPVNEQLNALFTEKFDGTSSNQLPDENKPDAKTKGDKQEKVKKKAKTGDIIIYNKFGEEVIVSRPVFEGLMKKVEKSGIDIETLGEVYSRGRDAWQDNGKLTQEQYAFARVNSYINEGSAYYELDADLHGEELHEKRGLWDNIHAKRKRIKSGSGEHMRKPGSKGAPTAQNFKDAQESVEIDEAKSLGQGINHLGKSVFDKRNGKTGVVQNSYSDGSHSIKWKGSKKPTTHDWMETKAHIRINTTGNEHKKYVQEEVELEESNNTPYVRPHIEKGSTKQTGWKASNKHGKVKYFGMDFKKSAEKHAGINEETELDEGIKEKIKGAIRREKAKDMPFIQNRRDYAAKKAGEAYEKGDEKKGRRYMDWREKSLKKEDVDLEEASGWINNNSKWKEAVKSAHGDDVTFKTKAQPGVSGKKDTHATNSKGTVVGVYQHHNKMGRVYSEETESVGTKKRRKEGTVVSRPDTKPSKMGKQKELKDKVLDEEGNSESNPAKREVGTDSVVKAFKKDTPGQDPVLNESFNIAYSAGVGVTLTAADLGMKVKSGFELHPSVVEELKKLDAEEESE